jgi:hypothetical protein
MVDNGLLQLRVLRLGLNQDRDIRLRIFPQSEEILVSGLRFRDIAGQCIRAAQTRIRTDKLALFR